MAAPWTAEDEPRSPVGERSRLVRPEAGGRTSDPTRRLAGRSPFLGARLRDTGRHASRGELRSPGRILRSLEPSVGAARPERRARRESLH